MADIKEESAQSNLNETQLVDHDNHENTTNSSELKNSEKDISILSIERCSQTHEKDHYREDRDLDRKRHREDDHYHDRHQDRGRDRHHSRDDDRDRYSERDRHSNRDKDYYRDRDDDKDRYRDKDRSSNRSYPSESRNNRSFDNKFQQRSYQKPLSAADKKKLLWGSKKTEPTNNVSTWKAAEFDDPERKSKFLKLMGAKKREAYNPLDPDSEEEKQEEIPTGIDPENAYTLEKQSKLYNDLERQFIGSVSRIGSQGRSGLG